MSSSVVIRGVASVLVLVLVTSPVSAVTTAEPVTGSLDTEVQHNTGVAQSDERCGTIENATVSDIILSVEIANGTVENLEIDGEETNATIRNGSILFDQVELSIDRAALDDESVEPSSEAVTVTSGSFFLQNATATVDGENVTFDNRRLTVANNAASDAGITVTGVDRLPRAPEQLLGNSSIGTLTFADLSGDLQFDTASREVLGVVILQMEDVELSASPLRPTFEEVTVSDGTITANSVSVPVENGDVSINELDISSEGVTFGRDEVSADLEDETARFDDVTMEQTQLNAVVEDAC